MINSVLKIMKTNFQLVAILCSIILIESTRYLTDVKSVHASIASVENDKSAESPSVLRHEAQSSNELDSFPLDPLSYGAENADEEEKRIRNLIRAEEYDKAITALEKQLDAINTPWRNQQEGSQSYNPQQYRRLIRLLSCAYELSDQSEIALNLTYFLHEPHLGVPEAVWAQKRIDRVHKYPYFLNSIITTMLTQEDSLTFNLEEAFKNPLLLQSRETGILNWSEFFADPNVYAAYRLRYKCAQLVEPRLFWLCDDLPDFDSKNKLVQETYKKFLTFLEDDYKLVVSGYVDDSNDEQNVQQFDDENFNEEEFWQRHYARVYKENYYRYLPFFKKLIELP